MGKMKEEYERQIQQRGMLPEEIDARLSNMCKTMDDLKEENNELKIMIIDIQNQLVHLETLLENIDSRD